MGSSKSFSKEADRRGRQRDRQKINTLNKQNKNFARGSRFFCTFLSLFWSLQIQVQEGSPTFDQVSG